MFPFFQVRQCWTGVGEQGDNISFISLTFNSLNAYKQAGSYFSFASW